MNKRTEGEATPSLRHEPIGCAASQPAAARRGTSHARSAGGGAEDDDGRPTTTTSATIHPLTEAARLRTAPGPGALTWLNGGIVLGPSLGVGASAAAGVVAALDVRGWVEGGRRPTPLPACAHLLALKALPRSGPADRAAALLSTSRNNSSHGRGNGGAAAREAALLRALASPPHAPHPHLPAARAVLDDPAKRVVVVGMDCVGGGRSLEAGARRSTHGRLPSPASAAAARAALAAGASALAHLHAVGVAHGDVKPANLLLASDGRIVLADLGSARPAAGGGGGRGGAGPSPALDLSLLVRDAPRPPLGATPAFSPPELERAQSASCADAAAGDVWALGVSAAAVACGGGGGTEAGLPALSAADPGLAAVVGACLEPDPADRPTAADVAARAAALIGAGGAAAGRAAGAADAAAVTLAVGAAGGEETHGRGAVIVSAGSPAPLAFLVLAGSVEVVAADDGGTRPPPPPPPPPPRSSLFGPTASLSSSASASSSSDDEDDAEERTYDARAAAALSAAVAARPSALLAVRGPGALVAAPGWLAAVRASGNEPSNPPTWHASLRGGPTGARVLGVRVAEAGAVVEEEESAPAARAPTAAQPAPLSLALARAGAAAREEALAADLLTRLRCCV